MAGRDGTSGDNKDFKMVPMMDGKGKPVLDGKGKPVMTKQYKKRGETTSSSGGSATSGPRKASTSAAPSTSKRPQARPATLGAKEAIDRSGQGPRTRSGPRRKKREAPTATSVTTPEVTTTKLAPRAPTLSGYTWEEYKAGNNLGRLRRGLPMGLSKSEFAALAAGGDSKPAPSARNAGTTAGRRDRRAAARAAAAASTAPSAGGMAKGGLVKANCGASMKPTQKSTRKK